MNFSGSLRRRFCLLASKAVNQRRRSAQVLLTLASPSTQAAQSRSCSCFQSQLYFTFYSVLVCRNCQLYTTMLRGTKSALKEPKQAPSISKSNPFNRKADFLSRYHPGGFFLEKRIYPPHFPLLLRQLRLCI